MSLSVIADLKAKASDAHRDMFDWLGARFLREMQRWGLLTAVSIALNTGLCLGTPICGVDVVLGFRDRSKG